MDTPLRAIFSWHQFLACGENNIEWSRVWEPQMPGDRLELMEGGCTCSLDPFIICRKHHCHCRVCGNKDSSCHWRELHYRAISSKLMTSGISYEALIDHFSQRMSYIALIEKAGFDAPSSPRERNLLNIMSLFPEMHPLGSTPHILDISQDINRTGNRVDGLVGTMATSVIMWSVAYARILNIAECFKLMGHSADVQFDGLSMPALRRLLGMSLHIGTASLLTASMLASIGS